MPGPGCGWRVQSTRLRALKIASMPTAITAIVTKLEARDGSIPVSRSSVPTLRHGSNIARVLKLEVNEGRGAVAAHQLDQQQCQATQHADAPGRQAMVDPV